MVTSFLKSELEEGAGEEKDDWSYYAEWETEAQGGEFIRTQVTGKIIYNALTGPPTESMANFQHSKYSQVKHNFDYELKALKSGLLQKSIKYYLSKKNSFDNCQADFLWEI